MKLKKTYIYILLMASLLGSTVDVAAQQIADSTKVNIAFGTKAKSELMGGVSAIDMVDLTEKDYSTYLENLQAYAGGYTGALWNQDDALVLVDGVPRDANNVLPSEIAQITFLKSASAVALYGSRAAKGAILITTKRGNIDGLKVSARGNAALFTPKEYPTYLGAAQYMSLYNEALTNDGLDPIYSDETIYNYASGKNPYRYPSINFFSDNYLKKSYQRYEGTAEFEGGGRFAHFYANIGLYNVGDLIKFGEGKNNHTTRLNVRGNVDLRLNSWISGWVNANATFYDVRTDRSDFWAQSATLRPATNYPLTPLIPLEYVNPDIQAIQDIVNNSNYIINGKYLVGGTQAYPTNPFAGMYSAGHNTYTSRQLQFDAGLNIDLGKVLKGLSFRSQFAIDYSTKYNTAISNDYATYEPVWSNMDGKDEIVSLNKYGLDKRSGNQVVSDSHDRQTIFFSAQFDYNRQFGEHGVDATFLAHGYQISNDGEYHHISNANLGLDLNYNYAKKYYAELTLAAIHSAKLAEGHREAISPVLSLAWDLKKENFLKDVNWLNKLKLNTSYGVLNQDLDIEDYYMYDDIFTATGTWWGWSESANSMQTSDSQRGGNDDLGFIKRKEFRIGLDAGLWNGLIDLDANFFNIATDGLITTPSVSFPSYFQTYWPVSTFLSNMNYNNQRRTGFDFTVNVHKKFDEVDLNLGVTGLTYSSENTKWSENVEYDWLKQKGASTSALRGYECLGFFKDADDVKNSAVINSNTKPGDLKYKDQNGDGIIDGKDQVVLGDWSPDFYLGLNFTAKYKNFTLFINGTGNFGATGVKDNTYEWVYGDRKYSDVVLGRWTEATASTATYPRLTTQGGELNFVTSDFWTYSTDAFRLNKVQLTYDFPSHMFANTWVSALSVYLSGSDLLTIAKERKYMETAVGSAPQTRSYNLGVKVTF